MKNHLNWAWGGFLGLAATSCATAPDAPAVGGKPNFIFILMDDMGYADLSCYGETRWQTPNIDSLASQGIRFTDCYAASPISSPSRAGLLTGRYPARMGIKEVFYPDSYTGMSPDEVTMAELLKPQGYATACIGKWHLGSRERFLPMQQGFDEYFGIPYSNDMSAQVYLRGNEVEEFHIDIGHVTRRYTEEAVDFIRRKAGQPFFLYLAHSMMHVPIYVSEDFAGKSGAGIYGDAAMEVDWSVGRIMDTLKEFGLDENTMVVFTSDNGPWLQEGPLGGRALPLREGKTTDFEGGVRVPCIVWWKGRIQPAVNAEVASLLDWFPTVAALSGATLPEVKLDGCDLTPVLDGKGQRASQDYAYFRNNHDISGYRSGDWKLMLPAPGIRGNFWRTSTAAHDTLLFNLREDVGERVNLYRKEPGKAREMVRKLKDYAENFGEIPPALVVTGNDASRYLRRQRQQAREEAEAAGMKPRVEETESFREAE